MDPQYPSYGNLFPGASLSVKSARADSLFIPFKKLNFSIVMGAAASRYLFFNEDYFFNYLDKSPFHVFSKRFWGGFGLNYRRVVNDKLTFDADITPCIQIIVDKSEETKMDTSGWNSMHYENIYQGLHLYAYAKLEYKTQKNYAPFFSISASVPVLNSIARDPGDTPYHNLFKGQLFLGFGLSYYYRSRHVIENDAKTRSSGKNN